jgi:16S rRNA (cytosine967-C5)-methyltransferase
VTSRELARGVLERVERRGAFAGRALSAALDRAPSLSPEERALATELTYGVLRRRARLDRALSALATRSLDGLDVRVRIALWVGAYQVLFLDRIPAYAAVSETVEACKRIKGAGVAGLANALLRKLAAGGEPPLPDAGRDPLGYVVEAGGLPPWMARLLLAELPAAEAVAFADAVAVPAPVTLRANTLRATREEVAARLHLERPGAELEPSPIARAALLGRRLEGPAATRAWADGLYAIQDVGAQAVVELLGASPGERILDACAGNGGKSAHLAALAGNGARIDAVDISATKLGEAERACRRLGVEGVTTLKADLTRPLPDATPRYARILLDAPCSGLGVIRRHPEALSRRTAEELPALAARQRQMLAALAPTLLPGGALVYAVCTFDRMEAEEVVAAFLADHPDFRLERSLRTWPHRDDADAFFAARLLK